LINRIWHTRPTDIDKYICQTWVLNCRG